ncbi:TolC family protein [Bdellovibrio sp. HCB337]|uniref:TolC family protein n=1 Tax=Bdellovibrio sp. HCB337 TaxID=3394358 RepID=UPI0039A740DA
MKLLKIVVLSIALICSQTFAATPAPTMPTYSGDSFVLNQNSLQSQLLRNNLELLQALYAVHDAKDQVNIARANLLPSLNLGGLLSFSGGGFVLASIDFLVPFLVPSNWYNFYTEKNLFEAEKISYNAIQLNVYSSAVSLYFTMVADRQIQEIYQRQYHDLQDVFEYQKQRSSVGLVPVSDLLQTQAQAQMAGVKASQLAELNKQEIAAIRKFLSLPLEVNIRLEPGDIANSPFEFEPLQVSIQKANTVSLERAQIQYLVKAATLQKWSKVFSFINGASVGSRAVGTSNAGFKDMQANGSMNFGFAQFPTYELNERRIASIKLQDLQLQQENTRIIESTVGSLQEARRQLDLANQAELQMSEVYEIRRQDYEQGNGTLIDVLQARDQMVVASVAKIKAQLDVNLQRTVLHRTLLTAQFGTIKGCAPTRTPPEEPGKFQKWKEKIGGKKTESHATLDEICRGK